MNTPQYDYLIVGDGRFAKHLCHYLSAYPVKVTTWSRKNNTPEALLRLSLQAKWSLLAVSDVAIHDIGEQLLQIGAAPVHFSGSVHHDLIPGFHPLMSFTERLLDGEDYKKLPFISTEPQSAFAKVFPHFRDNPFYTINIEDKATYHALCVMANNFTTVLWQIAATHFEGDLGLPKSALIPILEATLRNIKTDIGGALSGPFHRKDSSTIDSHKSALKRTPLLDIYLGFEQYFVNQPPEH